MTKIYYFSPTGGTAKVVEALSKGFKEVERISILVKEPAEYIFNNDDAAVFVAPVFAGRIPEVAVNRLRKLQGNGRPAVVIAVYGNREFDDALLELADVATEQGFTVISGIAALAQHSLSSNVAKGRPDEEDNELLKEYAEKIQSVIDSGVYRNITNELPGKRPYRERKENDVCSYKTEECIECGRCAVVCPERIISPDTFEVTEPLKCINCKACVTVCPVGARYLLPEFEKMIQEKLSPLEGIRKDMQFF